MNFIFSCSFPLCPYPLAIVWSINLVTVYDVLSSPFISFFDKCSIFLIMFNNNLTVSSQGGYAGSHVHVILFTQLIAVVVYINIGAISLGAHLVAAG